MNTKYVIPLALASFILCPLLTIVFLLIIGITIEKNMTSRGKCTFVVLFGVMCSIFVSLINMVIICVYESDLENYLEKYKMASQYDLLPYLLVAPWDVSDTYKEPLYHVIAWILNRLYNGSEQLYKFTISFIEYFFCVSAIILFGRIMKMKLYVVIAGVIWICFYPYIFTNSMNLIRQTVANGLLLYIIVRHLFDKKKEWLGMLAMPFIHTSSILFLPLLLLSGLGKPLKQSWYYYLSIIILLLGFQVVSQHFLEPDNLNSESAVGYALSRASKGSAGEYEFSILSASFTILLLVISMFVYSGKNIIVTNGLRWFLSIVIILSIFILSNVNNGQIAIRYSHYAISFWPFLIMILLESKRISNSLIFLLSFFIITLFTIYIQVGFWKYDVFAGGWFTPLFGYLI